MLENKEMLKAIIIIIIISITIICSVIFYKKETEEFIYYNYVEDKVEKTIVNQTNNEAEATASKIKVYVTGEVNIPGVKELEEGARIEDAINCSGGITSQADISKVNLAYPLEDGQKLYIPNINDKNTEEYISIGNENGVIENASDGSVNNININKATVSELMKIPGVGEALAKRIIDYRKENGKFIKIEDLKNVSGIGDKKFDSLKEYIVTR